MSWDREDDRPVAVENVLCIAESPKAFKCMAEYDARAVTFWCPKKLITPGCEPKPNQTGTLSIPLWFWKRKRRDDVEKKPPPVEFEADQIYRSAIVAWNPLDTVTANDARGRIADLYLACRGELRALGEMLAEALAKIPIKNESESCRTTSRAQGVAARTVADRDAADPGWKKDKHGDC